MLTEFEPAHDLTLEGIKLAHPWRAAAAWLELLDLGLSAPVEN